MKKLISLLCLFTSLLTAAQQNLDTVFKKAAITGVQLQFNDKGKTISHTYGKLKSDEKNLVNSNTIFQAASLSKTILAYITMRLYDRKIISLDTPLYHYFQYARIKGDTAAWQITARMVLHHTTGFPNWGANPTKKEWATSVLKTNFKPGLSFSYSGEGFMFLQRAIEHLTGKSLETLAKEEVFDPMGMTSSSFIWQSRFDSTAAYGHDEKQEPSPRAEPFQPWAAFSLLTTASDFSKFLMALMNGTGLNRATHEMMFHDKVSVRKNEKDSVIASTHIFWGLGFGLQENEQGEAAWHWGDNGDFKCFFMAFPAQQKSLVYFTNSENGLKIAPVLLDHFFGKQSWWASRWLDTAF